ncbi:hypothetical protein ACS3QZ_19445 (plasmid) [Shimia sp. W99]
MQITFTPMRRDDALILSCQGETLIVNGTAHDFSALTEGAHLTPEEAGCDWLAGDVTRENGVLQLTLVLPHGARAPQKTLFPASVSVTGDGSIPVPAHSLPEEEVDSEG